MRTNRSAWLFLAPALLFYGVFFIYPMLFSLGVSFTDWDGLSSHWRFVALKNYTDAFWQDPASRLALKNTAIWAIVCLVFPTTLGLALAVLLDRNIPAKSILRGIFYLPGILPLIAVGLIWSWIYNPYLGVLNDLLSVVGLRSFQRGWLGDPHTALAATLIAAVWQGTGFPMLLYLAGLQSIPRSQFEAAQLEDASAWDIFRHVTLPSLRETTTVVVCLGVLNSVRAFDLIYAMTYGGPGRSTQVMATWMYFNLFQYNHAGIASALAWIITSISMLVVLPYLRLMMRS
jgi:ABC-type sugar transport system permease subunit